VTAVELEDVEPSDPAVIFLTSGTTSIPKCVLHSHGTLLQGIEKKRFALDSCLVPNGTLLGLLPLYHIMGYALALLFSL
jgi:acyl-CoA synthetase (AMP-forming)/AMP-acid ligase II